jgi:hypothetical protein
MKIEQVRCPYCGDQIFTRDVDPVILCKGCGKLHTRDGIALTVDYDVGTLLTPGEGEQVYLPFWVLNVAYHINNVDNKEILGFLKSLFGAEEKEDGQMRMYVPAFVIRPTAFKGIAMDLTASPPKYKEGKLEPEFRRMPCVISRSQAEKMANFIFVTGIAERPGVLQDLDYRLKVHSARLLYLLCYENGGQFESSEPTYFEMGVLHEPDAPFDFSTNDGS